jgi:rubrerythrin
MSTEASLTPKEILDTALAKEKAAFSYYDRMLALAKEKAAFSYYDRMLKATNIEVIQDLLQELKNEEYKHVKMVENKIRLLNLG